MSPVVSNIESKMDIKTLIVALVALVHLARGDESCSVLAEQCAFPFVSESGEEHNACVERSAEDSTTFFACQTTLSSVLGTNWGHCDSGCLAEDASPKAFEGDTSSLSVFCKTKSDICVFPFVYSNKTYDACTSDDADFEWCATRVDQDGNLMEGFYGQCDPRTCNPDYYQAEAEALFEGEIVGEVLLRQHENNASLEITGTVEGFPADSDVGIFVHEADNCDDIGDIFGPLEETSGQVGVASTNEEGVLLLDLTFDTSEVSVFETPEESSLLHRALLVRLLDSDGNALPVNDTETITAACAVIEKSGGMSTLVLVLHILALVAIILLVLLFCLICVCCCRCCCKRSSRSKDPNASDAPIQNGGSKRRPLFDELSIPFIDASPSTTPKTGRSVEKLAFFRRSSSVAKSRVSLSSVPPLYTPPPPPAPSKVEVVWKEKIKNSKDDKVVV